MIEFDKDEATKKFHETAEKQGVDISTVDPGLLDFAVNATPHMRQFQQEFSRLFAESIHAVWDIMPKETPIADKYKEVVCAALFSYICNNMDDRRISKMVAMLIMDQTGALDEAKKMLKEEEEKENGQNN